MKRTTFDEHRDLRTVGEFEAEQEADSRVRCFASGCPNRWSVERGDGGLCRFHAWSDPRDWPAITEQQNRSPAVMPRFEPSSAPRTLSLRDRVSRLQGIKAAVAQRPPSVEWAEMLRDREDAGEVLTLSQRHDWRAALRFGARQDDGDVLAHVADRQAEQRRKVAEYAQRIGVTL